MEILSNDNSAPLESMSHRNWLGPFLALPLNFPITLLFQPDDGGNRFVQGDPVSARQHGRSQPRQIVLQMSEEYKMRISLIPNFSLPNVC